MTNESLMIETIVFVVILLTSLFILKLSNIISVILALIGFGVAYYSLKK